VKLQPGDAFSVLPDTLRADLLDAFNEIIKNYREHRWEPSELNGGKLCEAVFTIIEGYLEGGKYPARAKKPSQFPQTCWALEQKYSHVPASRSARILIPRMMIGLYDIRNNRGVGHAGADVNPNLMDATVVVYTSKWLVSELVRLLHTLTTDEATDIVEGLIEREIPWVWTDEDMKRVLHTGLTWKQQTLVILLTQTGPVAEADLVRWLEHRSVTDYRKAVLRPMHKDRLLEYDEAKRTIHLLPPGVTAAEVIIADAAQKPSGNGKKAPKRKSRTARSR
jgi:hypothetical protein